MAENVKVIVRCRPMNKKEQDLGCSCVIRMQNCMVETWDPADGPSYPKQFTFDSTYDQDSQTEAIYNDICYPLIESVLDGYNATIFVYGQTGCGKSFTMEGTKSDPLEKGVISRAFEHIFESMSVTTGVKYLALISYLEIYNEQIRDLLLTGGATNLTLKETQTEGVTVPNLTTHAVCDAAECERYLSLGSKNRIIGSTLMNQNSSRSHSIFTIQIEQIATDNQVIRKGKLNLVDLAGSERQTKTGATGERLREATKINLSLSALGNVISALVDGKAKHIPYRDSKLTRLLQDSLGGNTRTLMIACVSPASRDYVETLSTLRYANRAKNIHNQPKVNEDPKDAILRQYQDEIERLKSLLNNNNNEAPKQVIVHSDKLREYEVEVEKLKELHASERSEKESVMKQIEVLKRQQAEVEDRKQMNEEEIKTRIEQLKHALIVGGEKANDAALSEKRKKKKMAAEKRASLIAHLLAKIDMNEDRELLHNEYKDISQELSVKTDALRRYRHKVKMLEKEIKDIQSEFEVERQDYLEMVRKQEKQLKLYVQLSEKMADACVKKECNYSNLSGVKSECVWMEEVERWRLPDVVVARVKLPAAPPTSGMRFYDTQTAPARLSTSEEEVGSFLDKKLENGTESEGNDIITSYFQPTTRRVNELLKQSSKLDAETVFNRWRKFARRNQPKATRNNFEEHDASGLRRNRAYLSNSFGALPSAASTWNKKALRLDALPNIHHRAATDNNSSSANSENDFL